MHPRVDGNYYVAHAGCELSAVPPQPFGIMGTSHQLSYVFLPLKKHC